MQNATMTGTTPDARQQDVIAAAVPALGLVLAVTTVALLGREVDPITRLAHLSPILEGLDVVAGISAVVAGAFAWVAGRRAPGLAAMAAGLCWFGAGWAGNSDLPGTIRAIGVVAATLTLPAIAVAATGARRLVLAVGAGLAGLGVLWVIAWVPSLDPRCLAICDINPVGALGDFRLARALANGWQALTVALGAGLGAWALRRLAQSSAPARRQRGAMLVGSFAVGATWAAWGVSQMLPSTVIPPTAPVAVALWGARAIAMVAFAAGLSWLILNARQMIGAIQGLAERLTPFPGAGSLEAGLGEALRDSRLRLVYALPRSDGFVHGDGRAAAVDRTAFPADRVTEIRKGDEVVAVAIRSSDAIGESVPAPLGAAVQLAADNERLLAALKHEVIELRDSRRRIVETGDAARRTLERNLHDGAQQRLLGIVHDLAVAREAALAAGDPRGADLERAVDEADETIEALRALARGIYPGLLAEAGLAAALEALAVEAPVPVAIEAIPDTRFDRAVESAAWRFVARSIDEASRLGAGFVRIGVVPANGRITIRVDVNGLSARIDTTSLEDGVGAAGGDVVASQPADGQMCITADLPCG
jgi:signal transduction histidine kinase